MGIYQRHILPRLIDLAMRGRVVEDERRRLLPAARGRVLEFGVGSGLNLPFYGGEVTSIVGVDPSPELLAMAAKRASARGTSARRAPPTGAAVELIEAGAEALPIEDASIDTVVTTFTLCSIPEVEQALGEARRVLKPGGRLLFVEHGLAHHSPGVARWQHRLTPAWRCIAGGCHLDRPIADLIRESGFDFDRIDTGFIPGPKPMTFLYRGSARPR